MPDKAFTLRWGILGAGNISQKFVRDLVIDPCSREVNDVAHKVVAVGSRSKSRAQEFIGRIDGLKATQVKAYGSYQELVSDEDVDIVYIGTPHTCHYFDATLCLQSKKHVLCEKPITVNANQIKVLVKLAQEKTCFLMEALWTRHFPLTYSLQEVIDSGEIGEVERVHADQGIDFNLDSLSPDHRLVNPDLAGGALLDQGPYSWTMLALTLLHQYIKPKASAFGPNNTPASSLPLPKIVASSALYRHPKAIPKSQPVDGSTIAILEFPTPSGRVAQGLLIASMYQNTNEDGGLMIYGGKGRIKLFSPLYCPRKFVVTRFEGPDKDSSSPSDSDEALLKEKVYHFDIPGNATGYMWEADEAARCIRDRKLQSERMPLAESILMMEVFDEIRRQTGVDYPKSVELLES